MALAFVSLALGTLVSEDLACVTAGVLIQRGELDASVGILACTLGIFVGDVGLWAAGRIFGRAVLAWPWVGRQLAQERYKELRASLERHAASAIVASRFLPGTRLPLYLIAGMLRLPARVFAGWALVAALLWTPLLVLVTARVGEAFVKRISLVVDIGWVSSLLTAGALLLLLQAVQKVHVENWRSANPWRCSS